MQKLKTLSFRYLVNARKHLRFYAIGMGIIAISLGNVSAQIANPLGATTPEQLLQLIVRILLGLIGFVAVIYLIWAGFKYVTAGGDSKKAGEAKEGITHAIIGLIVAFVGYLLVELVYSLLGVSSDYGPGTIPSDLTLDRTT